MDNEQIVITLKGISSILTVMSETPAGETKWMCWGIVLLNMELRKCIETLEENMM